MATGIVSLAAHLLAMPVIADTLFRLNIVISGDCGYFISTEYRHLRGAMATHHGTLGLLPTLLFSDLFKLGRQRSINSSPFSLRRCLIEPWLHRKPDTL
ncbi:hypothetical protein [Nitrosococcus oceani]|uniref:hypothetical protein n=1 Tax=Nitrosococcus oceani TaxID=1229 RepID=UPI000AFAD2B5|nr:hypothetical protein [Nitrosococcus oceani]